MKERLDEKNSGLLFGLKYLVAMFLTDTQTILEVTITAKEYMVEYVILKSLCFY